MNASAHRFKLAALGLIVLMSSCERNNPEVPGTLSNWPEMSYPQDNQPDASKINLGRQLFEDPILSIDSSISCASCHKSQIAFADNLTVSPGVEGRLGVRNSPSLLNIGYQPYFMREGGVPTLEMQILVPIQEHNEMAFNMVLLANRLNQDSTYKKLFLQAFNDSATAYTITRSIAQYERTLIYKDADIDAYISGDNNAITGPAPGPEPGPEHEPRPGYEPVPGPEPGQQQWRLPIDEPQQSQPLETWNLRLEQNEGLLDHGLGLGLGDNGGDALKRNNTRRP